MRYCYIVIRELAFYADGGVRAVNETYPVRIVYTNKRKAIESAKQGFRFGFSAPGHKFDIVETSPDATRVYRIAAVDEEGYILRSYTVFKEPLLK